MEEKIKFSMEEMTEKFLQDYPYLHPNRKIVGRYARQNGYTRISQSINKKQVYFYVKAELVKK